jgi:hypothetical protein
MWSLAACTSPAVAKSAAGVDGAWPEGASRASPDLAQGPQGGGQVVGDRVGRRRRGGGVEGGLGKGKSSSSGPGPVRACLLRDDAVLASGGAREARRCGFDAWPREALPEMDEGHDGCAFTHGPAG